MKVTHHAVFPKEGVLLCTSRTDIEDRVTNHLANVVDAKSQAVTVVVAKTSEVLHPRSLTPEEGASWRTASI